MLKKEIGCEFCPHRETCTSLCDKIKLHLAAEEKVLERAHWVEFGYDPVTLDFLFNAKRVVGKDSIIDTTEKITHLENVNFIRYLIGNFLLGKQKKFLMDYFFRGLNQREIAEKANLSQPTIHFHIQAGVENLREFVKGLW